MSEQSGSSQGRKERTELPIERGFPIERVNEIAGREGHGGARQWYRPIYAMHKWWARRLGSVFRSISLYALLDDPEEVEVIEPGNNSDLSDYSDGSRDVSDLVNNVDITNPDSLWPLYNKDVRISNKKILDPFCGGGTSVVEASRFGVQSVGNDLNPVAWFVTKKELDAGNADLDELKKAFEFLESEVAEELQEYYQTPCPHCSHNAEAIYYFWVKELDCTSCGSDVPLFNDYRIANGRYEDEDGYYVYDPVGEEVIVVDDWQSECISPSGHTFNPKDGNVGRSKYSCPDCGQKYPITDAIQEQDGYRMNLYAVEYYCSHCDDQGIEKRKYKGYKAASEADLELFSEAEEEWNSHTELHEYVPSEELPPGHMTSERNPVFDHGVSEWTDMFNDRQLLTLAKLLKSIDEIDQSGFSKDAKEYLLLTFSDILRTNTMMTGYTPVNNVINQIFKTNSFDVPQEPVEGNPWGGKFGYATFKSSWDAVIRGVEWAKAPTERYVENGETKESPPFQKPVGENSEVRNGDVRLLEEENEYDAVITDPPYYDNIIYSEVSDYFYVWQKILLENEYEGFNAEKTPRAESIVANPFLNKGTEEFESELHEAFTSIHKSLKEDGVLAFTYHHSNSESWGELLESLCDVGFEVTATYPITADINKFITGEAVSFDIVVVARPLNDTEAASWNSLRRDIYRTARRTRQQLEEKTSQLEALNRVVRHDIRNDMAVISGWAEILGDHIDEDGEDALERVLQKSRHVIQLTEAARDFVESLSDDGTAELEEIEVKPLLDAELAAVRDSFPNAQFQVSGELADVSVQANEMLSSIFRNILENAVRHNDKETPKVTVTCEENPETVRYRIEDNGPGIPDNQKEQLFGKGNKGLDSPGSGIGLYLVHLLTDQFGGDVWLEDNNSNGSVFVVELPIHTPSNKAS